MNSFQITGRDENNAGKINVSQCSEDLFQESPQFQCNIQSSFSNDIKFSNEKSSETSDEVCFTPRRIPRRALSFSHDSSPSFSKNSCDSLRDDSYTDSSKFFQPISPAHKIDKIGTTSLLEVNQSSSPEACVSPGIHHLSKENVAVVSFVSESEHSDSGSILDDSLKSDNEYQKSKQFFKTPICSSVKKRTIRQWLNNVSLNCSLKPNENGLHNQHEVVLESNLSKDLVDVKPISVNVSISSSIAENNGHNRTYDVKELKVLNDSRTGHCYDNGKSEKSNTTENYCPWLFDSFENRRNDYCLKQQDVRHINENHKYSKEVNDLDASNSCQTSPINSISSKPHYKPSKLLDRSFHKDGERNISSRGNRSLSFNKSSGNYKSDDGNLSSGDDSDSTFNEICNSNPSKIVDSDDSFSKIRLFKKKKKQNCLNISSDDSEAKDTANESEDFPHHNNEPYTPRRMLYFRNPLNNSLDDDAKPLTCCNDYSINSKDNSRFIEKKIDKTKGILDKIYSEVHNVSKNNTSACSLQNQDNSSGKCSDGGYDIESDHALLDEPCVLPTGLSFTQSVNILNESAGSISHDKSIVKHLYPSPRERDDVNQLNFSSLCISSISKRNISENNCDIQINTNKDGYESCSASKDESQIKKVLDLSDQPHNEFDDTSDSIVNIKKKSKKNILNFSSDEDSFLSKKPNTNIIDVGEISDNELTPSKTNHTTVDLIQSDGEYDKYMYRTRSDSSFSDNEEIPGVPKDSSDVISVHTTTSEEEGDDEENSPWFDLESYLKKNIPASSKSLDSSFLKNSGKRNAQLARISLPTHSSCPYHTSFLLSLTPEVPDEMCHPEAVKYRGVSFSKHKNELVDLLFKLYNKEIFDEKLPPLEIKWSGHLTTTSGITKSSSKITKNGKIRNSIIKLSKTVVDDASKVRDVLLHELCHAANWLIDEQSGGHGPLFKKWVNKIWLTFPEVPKVKTTHHYELKWKYLYKCSYCGYELGKMKLSLNETSCRLCGGLVTVNT